MLLARLARGCFRLGKRMGDTTNTGIGFTGLLTVLFIGLKLTHYIDWSWWWVLSPLWISISIILIIIVIIAIIALIVGYCT